MNETRVPSKRSRPEAHTYGRGETQTHPGVTTVDLHLPNNAVAQVSALPEDKGHGFLVRVWPENGTHEYGGGNLTLLSVVISFDSEGQPRIEKFDWHEPWDFEDKRVPDTQQLDEQ